MKFGNENAGVVLHKIINSLPRKINTLTRAFEHDVSKDIISYNKITKLILSN